MLVGCGDNTITNTPTPTAPSAITPTDVDILNFALNLEYLEAEFYLRAATGSGLSAADGGGAAVTIPSGKVTFSNTFFQQLAFELAQTELQHVRAIRATITALGGTPIAAPALNFTDAFNAVANLAGLGTFNPFASDYNFLVGALTFEEIGVTAYTGAAKLITNVAVLDAAAGIQAAEAYHAGAIRTILVGQAISSGSTGAAQSNIVAYNSILQVLNKLDTGAHDTLLVASGTTAANNTTTPPTSAGATSASTTVVAADSNAVGWARTTDQVLHIAYAVPPGTYPTSGGFFPSGLNGTIKQPTT